MKTPTLICASLLLAIAPLAPGANVQTNFWYPSTVTTDANGPLDLLAELNYDDARPNAPIAVVMHGYSPATGTLGEVRANAQRLRDNGFFVISVAMRARDGSDGIRDSGGVEIHDIYDAVEAVKADPALAGFIDPTNVHITGYSGGGGNVMSALTKFPDYFRLGAGYFGMSDYGHNLIHGWYNNGAGSRTAQLNTDIGNPNTGGPAVLDRYLARASNRASKNNPYSEIRLFVNANETICPPINSTSYRDNAIAAESTPGEFDNITVHIGGPGIYQDFNDNSVNDANELQSWPHGFPTANQQDAAELWYRDRLLDGTIPQPVLKDADELFVAGYVVTSPFKCWLGDGQNAAGNLTYSLSDTAMSFSLSLLTSDLTKTGNLTIDTARMAGREIAVTLNDTPVTTITGGGTYNYPDLGHNDTLELTDNGPSTNEPPTLTSFAAVVATTAQDTEVEITFAALAGQGDEADADGTVTAFLVQAITSGTLKLGTSAGTATPFAPGSNDAITATTKAYWTPGSGVSGDAVEAFTAVARDNDLAQSSPPVPVTVAVSKSTTPTSAYVAYHDMGGPAYAAGVHITNHYTSSDNSFVSNPTPATVGLINYADGTATGVSVNITGINNFDHRTNVVLPPAADTPAAALFNGVGLDLSRGTLNRQNALMTITISGLDPTLLYDLAFYGDRTASADGSEQFSLVGADAATNISSTGIASTSITNQETRSNNVPGQVIRWTDINPGADGIITVEMDPRVTSTNIGHINAMRLEAFTVPVGDTFADWIVGFDLGGFTAPGDDPEGDGIPNAIENFFGTHPGESSQGLIPTATTDSAFTFTHPQNPDFASDLAAAYTWSADLINFHSDGATIDGTTVSFSAQTDTPTPGITTVTVTTAASGTLSDRLFIRIEVSEE